MRTMARLIFLLLLTLTSWPAIATDAGKPDRISVAYCTDCVPFHFSDEHGQPTGMIIDLWRLWEKKTGIAIDFHAAPWGETLKQVGDGRRQAHAGLFYNAERDQYLDYGAELTKTDSHVFLHRDLPEIGDVKDLAAYRIGVIAGDFVEAYLREHVHNDAVVTYDSYDDIIADLRRGRLLAFAADTPTGIYFLKERGMLGDYRIGPSQLLYSNAWHIAATDGSRELLKHIDAGMADISEQERLGILRQWVGIGGKADEQQAMIISLQVDNLPYSHLNDGGDAFGFFPDLWRVWSEKSGIPIRFAFHGQKESLTAVSQGLADIHPGAYPEMLGQTTMGLAKPYYQVSMAVYRRAGNALITRNDDLAGKKLGVPATLDLAHLRMMYPESSFVAYPNFSRLTAALIDDQLDGIVGEEPGMDRFLSKEHLTSQIVPARVRLMTHPLQPGVTPGREDLISLINKGMEAISLGELSDIEARWMVDPETFRFKRRSAAHYDFINTLTPEERAWLRAHPSIRLGADIAWPPFEWVKNKQLQGLTGEYFKHLERLLGVSFTPPPEIPWTEVLDRARTGLLDVLTLAQSTPERREYMRFTQPYLTVPQVLVQHRSSTPFLQLEDVPSDVSIGVVDGYATAEQLKDMGFGSQLVTTKNLTEGLQALTRGEIDVFVDNVASINYYIRELNLRHITITGQTSLDWKLGVGVRKDWEPLVEILNKAFAAITPSDRDAIYRRAGILSSDIRDFQNRLIDTNDQNGLRWRILAGTAAVFVILFVIGVYRLRQNDPARLFGSRRAMTVGGFIVALLLIVITLITSIGLMEVEKRIRVSEGDAIDTVLDTTQASFHAWMEGWKFRVEVLAGDPQLRHQAEQLLKLPSSSQQSLADSTPLKKIRELFHRYTDRYGDLGFFIISPAEISVGSMRDTNLGSRNLIAEQSGDILERAFQGETVLIPPLETDVAMTDDLGRESVTNATMFVATPILDASKEVIAVLTLRINPYGDFSDLAHAGRVGTSGESYLVDREGRLITTSRFEANLEELGLIERDRSSILNVHLRDPGRDLHDLPLYPYEDISALPLTQAGKGLLAHQSGRNLDGYRDYRGVPVLGAWTWDENLGVGIVTEIDRSEVLGIYEIFRNIVLVVLISAVFLSLVLTATTFFFGRAAHNSLTRSRNDLESEVQSRTRELSERENRLWDLYENSPASYASVEPSDWSFQKHNRAFADLVGHQRQNFGTLHWQDLIADGERRGGLETVADGQPVKDREMRVVRADNSVLDVVLSALPVSNGGEFIDEIRVTLIDVTERKASEQRFAALMESTPDPMLVINQSGELTVVNQQLTRVFGFSREELLGNKIEMLLPEDIRERHVGMRSRYFEHPDARPMGEGMELRARRKNGDEFPVEVSLSPIESDGEQLVVAVARDITERKAIADRIERSNRDLSTLTLVNEAVMQALTEDQLLYDVCRTIVEANGQRFAWVGFEQRNDAKSINPIASYGFEKKFLEITEYRWTRETSEQGPTGQVIRTAKPALVRNTAADKDYEPWRTPSLERGYHSVLAVPLSAYGDAFGAITIYSDQVDAFDEETIKSLERVAENVARGILTLRSEDARKATEAELTETEERSRLLLESVDEGIFGLDDEGRMTFVNPAGARMLGWEPEEMLGRKMHGLIHHSYPDGEHYPREDCWMYRSYVHGESHRIDDEVLWRKDGSSFAVEYSSLPMMKDGRLVGSVVSYRDVSELKKLADDLKIAKEQADDANKAKGDFLANMSHEIRTPMNAIIGMSQLALKTELNKKQRNYIDKVNRSAESLLGIINDILDFSKIEAGKMDIETIPFRLEDVFDNLANLLGFKSEDKGIELLFDIGADTPMALMGDPLRVGQILINLGNNAVKFTDEGQVVVRAKLRDTNEDGALIHFTVEDSGIGMTEEQLGRMFQSFSQADSSTTRKYGGTGLGLAISKKLTEMMGGEIWVESTYGVGSKFQFTARFPLQSDDQQVRLADAELPDNLRVLVADDNATAREILVDMLDTMNIPNATANSGSAALEAVVDATKREPFDLILMDWRMPGMDGIKATGAIQSQLGDKAPKVVLVTAYGREEATEQAEGVDFSSILQKPISASTLLESILESQGRAITTRSSHTKSDEAAEDARAKVAGAHVLLVEDNEINQELATELLETGGLSVTVAENGQIALDILAERTFDGVLMDCQMPVMDGYAATRHIREQGRFADLPVIAMTANAMAGDREKVIDAGMNDHIAKPIDVTAMFLTLAKWITPGVTASDAAPRSDEIIVPTSATPPERERPAPVPTAETDLSVLTGIDTAKGLKIVQGNEKLYRRLLGKFHASQADFENLFRTSLNDDDADAPTRTAHTLKGVAGNVGASDLQQAAEALELACKQAVNADRREKLLAAVLIELGPVMAGIALMESGGSNQNTDHNNAGFDATPEQLKQLRALLEEDDSEASDLIAELLDTQPGEPYLGHLRAMDEAISGYDFDSALESLAALENTVKETTP